MTSGPAGEPPLFKAAVDLIRRTGARAFQMRYSDDEQPVVWIAVAEWGVNEAGVPVATGGTTTHDAAAAIDPTRAVLRLLEQLVDGGTCAHCHRPTGFEPDSIDTMPADRLICWYQYDPELKRFRRACEGEQ